MPRATAKTSASSRSARSKSKDDGLAPGDYVTNPLKPDWGPGRVVELKRNVVFVYFRDRPGTEVIRMRETGLDRTDSDAELEALPDFIEKGDGYALPRTRRKKAPAKKKTPSIEIADSFAAFVEAKVLPHRDANPAWKRLDGATSGSNDADFGAFRYKGAGYRVHADTHFEPILVAYQAVQGGDEAPFTASATKTGERLDLKPELSQKVRGKARHLYAYGAAKA